MATSKKDYVAIAAIINRRVQAVRDARLNDETTSLLLDQLLFVAAELGAHFDSTNERFDQARFRAACGVQ